MPEDDGVPEKFESPLDDLFVEAARFQEPSAKERERQAKEFQEAGRKAAKANKKRKHQPREAREPHEAREPSTGNRYLPLAFFAVVVVIVWLLMEYA